MVHRVDAHLGTMRHRSEVAEYRVAQHFERLGDLLRRLGFVITSDITEVTGEGKENGPGATRTRDLLLRRGRPPPVRGAMALTFDDFAF
jgi:hypothetical protein